MFVLTQEFLVFGAEPRIFNSIFSSSDFRMSRTRNQKYMDMQGLETISLWIGKDQKLEVYGWARTRNYKFMDGQGLETLSIWISKDQKL